jgi:dTDP-4-amino-4,6-dideoxygalactose transaminase
MIPLFKPVFDKTEVLRQIGECLDSGWTGRGPKCAKLEEAWKEYTGLPHAHFVSSGTAGLHLALELAKVRRWDPRDFPQPDKVITTPLTFVATNHAIKHAKLTPWFADVDDSLNLDPKQVKQYLMDDVYNQILGVMFVCMGGSTTNLPEIAALCRKYNKLLIVDAAHSAGSAEFKKDYAGAHGDYAIFSFQSVKNLPTADSGMLCCWYKGDDKLARSLSWHGIDKETWNRDDWKYNVPYLGWKYNGNDIMAAMGLSQLPFLDAENALRRTVAGLYDDAGLKGVRHSSGSSRHLYQIRVPWETRPEVISYARDHGVELGVHYRDNLKYPMYDFRGWYPHHANEISQELISLPMGVHLSFEDVQTVIRVVKEAISV